MRKVEELRDRAWIYEGALENVGLVVQVNPAGEGGHVVALKLSNGIIRLMATRDPVRYIAQVRNQAGSFGSQAEVKQVFVSARHYQYQAIKRWLAQMIGPHRIGPDAYEIPIATLTRRIKQAFEMMAGRIPA